MLRAPVVVTLVVIACTLVAATARSEPPPPPPRAEPPPLPRSEPPPLPRSEPPRVDVEEPTAAQAKQHYNAGQKLYEEGRYEEAIAEFQLAYRLKPHPNTLYNIAQAYERLLDYAQSVIWFERYLAEASADIPGRSAVENRLRVLRNLPARISVTTIPEHVRATVVGDDGVSRTADTPTVFKVPAGRYTLELTQPGWEPETHPLSVDIGQPYFYQYRLKRSTAQVTIFTRPRGARVFIDDRLVGETPFAGTVEVGKHRLLLEHRDYPWHREELDATSPTPIRREVTLTRPLRSGRTELVLASMVFGGVVGPLLVAAINGDNQFGTTNLGLAVYVLSSAAGIGAGFLGSFMTTREGVKLGHSSLMIGSTIWAASFAASLGLGLELRQQYVYALALAGSGVGIAAGYLIARKLDVSAGDAALINSGGTWGTGAGALLAPAIFDHASSRQFGWFVLGGTTLGVLAGSLLASKLELSRSRVALIDVGGLAGTGLGFALGFAIGYTTSGENTIQSGARLALGGMALGLLGGAVLSRKYKGDLPPVEALLRRDGGRWVAGIPSLNVEYAVTPEGAAPRVTLTLARGRF
jgi:hypothetical protein